MRLSRFDLEQLDSDRLSVLSREEKDALLPKLIDDLKEARDQLNQNSQNSSRSTKQRGHHGKQVSLLHFQTKTQKMRTLSTRMNNPTEMATIRSNDTELSPTNKGHEDEE